MSENDIPENEAGDQQAAPDEHSGAEKAETPEPVPEELAHEDDGAEVTSEDRVEILEAQVADLNDKLLRAMAETENVRRRAQRDKEDASKYAIKGFAEQMITVSDNLARALQSVDTDSRADNPALDNIVVGIEMVGRELENGFERFGIKPIDALGQRFDPMLHEAMFEIEDKDAIAGTIAQVLETGYTLNGRTLRAAKVGITKGGPKTGPAPESGAQDTQDESIGDGHGDDYGDGKTAYESKGAEPGSNLDQEL